MIFDGDIVELAIIDTKMYGTIRLFNKKNRRAERRFGWTNKSLGDHVVDIVLQGLEVGFREVVDGVVDRFDVGDKRDFVVNNRAMRGKFLIVLWFEDVDEFGIVGRELGGESIDHSHRRRKSGI